MDTYGKKVWSDTCVPLSLLKNDFAKKTQIFRQMDKDIFNVQWCSQHQEKREMMIAGKEETLELTMQDRMNTDTECGTGLCASAGHRWEPQSLHNEGNPIAHKIASIIQPPGVFHDQTRQYIKSN